jgi:hypothetical protein
MKKAVFLLVLILTVSSGFSQQRKRVPQENQINAEQRTTLEVKKLTLSLDLDKNQAEKVTTLFLKTSKKRMAKREKIIKIEKATQEGEVDKEDLAKMRERRRGSDFNAQNNALDYKISIQNGIKKILTKEQFATYRKMQQHNVRNHKKIMRVKKKR